MPEFRQVAEQRRQNIQANRAIFDDAERQQRDLTDAERTEVRNRNTEISAATASLQLMREQRQQEDETARLVERQEEDRRRAERDDVQGAFRPLADGDSGGDGEESDGEILARRDGDLAHPYLRPFANSAYSRAFADSIASGSALPAVIEANARQRAHMDSMNTESDRGGNFLMPPPEFVDELIREAPLTQFMRRICRVRPLKGRNGIRYPKQTVKLGRARKTHPLGSGTVSRIEGEEKYLIPKKRKHTVIVEEDMSEDLYLDPVRELRAQTTESVGEDDEWDFMVGTGVGNEGIGIFTPHEDGVPVARDFDQNQFSDALTFRGMRHAKNRIPAVWRNKAVCVMHTDILEMLQNRKGEKAGGFIYNDSVREDVPDRIVSTDVFVSDQAPNSVAPGAYAAVFFVPQFFWIVDGFGGVPRLRILDQKFDDTDEIGYSYRFWNNHAPVQPQAFSRVKFGSAPESA